MINELFLDSRRSLPSNAVIGGGNDDERTYLNALDI